MHRAGVDAGGRVEGAIGPSRRGRHIGVLGHRKVDAPAHCGSVQSHLVDGLGRAPAVAQFGRTVRGADDERHSCVGGFHHRG